MKFTLSILSVFLFLSSFAQEIPAELKHRFRAEAIIREKLQPAIKKLYASGTSEEEKHRINQQLLTDFKEALSYSDTYELDLFDSLKNDIGILRSPDNAFRIIHWNIPKADGTHGYYGFIQHRHVEVTKKGMKKVKTEVMQLYPLTDKSAEIKNPENTITDHTKWFGCLYYKIIPKKTKSKTYYTLLGWDGNDKFSQKKIIEVLTFDNKGVPKFGADVFSIQKKYPKRVIFEYSADCVMALKYSSRKDSIVFDHLAPTRPELAGQFIYYCGDMSYDGLGFRKGKWNYGKDLNAINEKDENDRFYGNPKNISHGSSQSGILNPGDKKIQKKKREENLNREKKKK